MSNIIFRQSKRVILRPFDRSEIPTLCKWVNDPDVTQFTRSIFPVYEQQEEEWFDGLARRKDSAVLGIVVRESNTLIGTIGLHGINWQSRTATTGAMIGEKAYWGKGYGTEAKMLLLDFAFNTLDLNIIQSHALASNERSIAYSKKCGYEEVARIPDWHRRLTGECCADVILIVTQEKWRPLWDEFKKLQT